MESLKEALEEGLKATWIWEVVAVGKLWEKFAGNSFTLPFCGQSLGILGLVSFREKIASPNHLPKSPLLLVLAGQMIKCHNRGATAAENTRKIQNIMVNP